MTANCRGIAGNEHHLCGAAATRILAVSVKTIVIHVVKCVSDNVHMLVEPVSELIYMFLRVQTDSSSFVLLLLKDTKDAKDVLATYSGFATDLDGFQCRPLSLPVLHFVRDVAVELNSSRRL